MSTMNRRQWLARSGMLAATGVLLKPGLAGAASAPAGLLTAESPVRLHSNENPLGPSHSAREAMVRAFDQGYQYPSEYYRELIRLIAERESVSEDHVFLGSGSHEILRIAGMAYGMAGGEVVAGSPTYEGLGSYAETAGAYVHRVPLTDDFALDLEAMDRQVTQGVRLVFVCNPNNPTGHVLGASPLEDFCTSVSRRAVVLVDEAYHEYVDDPSYRSMVDLVRQGHNVVVSRTFSKIYGLAGLRVGYGLARPDIARRLSRFRTSHSVNIVGLHAAMASYQDTAFEEESRKANAAARQYLYEVLQEQGYRYLPSQANFVFFHIGEDVRGFAGRMLQGGVRVGRPFPPYRDWCRVSIGTMKEMQAFAGVLQTMSRP